MSNFHFTLEWSLPGYFPVTETEENRKWRTLDLKWLIGCYLLPSIRKTEEFLVIPLGAKKGQMTLSKTIAAWLLWTVKVSN